MRNILITLVLVISLAGCTEGDYTDNRPAEQARFVSIVREWRDTVNAAEKNAGLRGQLLENGVDSVKAHIRDSLQLQFKAWEARVLYVAPDPADRDYIVTSFGMNLDTGPMTEKNRYESVVFTSRTATEQPVHATLKTLAVGDIARINGQFKTIQKTINIDSYNDLSRSKNVLDNPEFRVEIGTVEKLKSSG